MLEDCRQMGTIRLVILVILTIVFQASVFVTAEKPACVPGFTSDRLIFKMATKILKQHTRLGKVGFTDCTDRTRFPFISNDRRVMIKTGGTLMVPVLHFPKSGEGLRRRKRDWVIPAINVAENDRGPYPLKISQVRSSEDKVKKIYYGITGPGADQPPVNLFIMDRDTGNLYLTQPLDREAQAKYTFQAHAVADGSGNAEDPMDIIVNVIDQNDNKPTFTQNTYLGEVAEASPKNFEVITVVATDPDQPNTDNSDIRYRIVSQDPELPSDLFVINSVSGAIRVNADGLDREKYPNYTLVVEAADMIGEGLTGQAKVILTVTDSSDNAPVFTQPSVPVLHFPKSGEGLRRRKRDWVIPDINVAENDRGPYPLKISQIRSSEDKVKKIYYSITGPGADQPPVRLFTMDRDTGNLYLTQPLDREAQAKYTFQAHAVADGSGNAEDPMDIIVNVIDQNDNKPIFTQNTYLGEVAEASPKNFEVITVVATDLDQPNTDNSDIRYRIISQDPELPSDLFVINSVSGAIRVNAVGLDREKYPKYTLVVEAADMVGEGLSGQAKVILTVTDSNDNAPAFTQNSYEATVAENKVDAQVVTISVTDGDDEHSPAWNAKFKIVDGDPGGFFTVKTATNKQQGIISTAKGLDFEKSSKHTLLVTVENEIPFATPLPTATATVMVKVQDVNEAPVFDPVEKLVSKAENLPVDSDVVLYTASDPDTARKQNITYRIIRDPAGWLNVEKETGLIKVKSIMDRESSFVKDNKYIALIGAYDDDDVPATGTGTLMIQLEDVNDNAPTIEERTIRVCNKESAPQLLSVTDKDGPGFAAPYSVSLQGMSKNNWTVRMNNSKTGIILNLATELASGDYTVVLRVSDNLDLHQNSTVQATVCDCSGEEVRCQGRIAGGTELPIILGILGGILLLLMLVLLLLLFARRRRGEKKEPLLQDNDIRDNIYYYDEEGGGEDDQDYDLSVLHRGLDNRPEVFRNDVVPSFMPAPQYRPRPANPEEIGNFIDHNLKAADNDPTAPPYDSLLVFDYEGGGSDAGSLSSLNSSSSGDQDYDCLNEWGPRFKKLADMFGGGDDML
uniref:B-cadherin-like isoform X4 n=2 Tax=Scatophagus argus TaxID=75038 RepID=UPI001ED84ADF|nr:B-cadherin-like isoform X4 [Scatophagus argus]